MRAGRTTPEASIAGPTGVGAAAPRRREDQRRVEAREDRVERVKRGAGQWDLPPGTGRLAESDDFAVADGAKDVQQARATIDVAPLECLPLLGAQAGGGRERGERGVGGRQLRCSDSSPLDEEELGIIDVRDVGNDVTTDPAMICDFLRGDGRRVVFATYQSSPQIAQAMRLDVDVRFDRLHAHGLLPSPHRALSPVCCRVPAGGRAARRGGTADWAHLG